VEAAKNLDEPLAIAVLPDHPTPCELKTHTHDAIPFLIYKPGITPDETTTYNEESAKKGYYGILKGNEFIREFLKNE
jgi:2,3-bisphosphoglycerate-independent phosphoglycerate mutase